jgi:hypothetical protein
MSTLALQRCLHHVEREAVARCPECAQHFCRECIVEHEGRVLCSACRKNLVQREGGAAGSLRRIGRYSHLVASVLLLWFCFFLLGKALLAIPASFHEGDAWKTLRLPE